MPSPTDFNLTPYFDDFNEDKKFHRILFRPAYAVQARELTQSQTIQQNQVESLSDHFFKKGAMVIPGEISYDLNYFSVKVENLTGTSILANFQNVKLTGGASGIEAEVINTQVAEGSDADTIFVKYLKSGTDNTTQSFNDNETLSGTATIDGVSTSVSLTVSSTHTGSAAFIAEGTYYINGFHVQVNAQTLLLDKYTNTPSFRVGLQVTESFVQSTDDASLLDNAQGSSNVNAPGADRFKIDLTLTKKTLSSTEDNNFVELLRLSNGVLRNLVRTTEYSVLEDTLARRTFDESGDYVVRNFDLDIREHIIDGDNRGVFTLAQGGSEAKMAAGLSPGKAYIQGYEVDTIGTQFIDVEKAREFSTQNNFKTRFNVANFVYVNKVYGAPDIGFVSGSTEAFKPVQLFNVANAVRGTLPSTDGAIVPQVGQSKSRGFEYHAGTTAANIFSSASKTSGVYKHYLFDTEMFTHIHYAGNASFTNGEVVTGGTSAATAIVQSASTNYNSLAVAAITTGATPQVQFASAPKLEEGQQVSFDSPSFNIASVAVTSTDVFTVRQISGNNFELFNADGTTRPNVTSFTSCGNVQHGVLVVSNVKGTFNPAETITGAQSSSTRTIQSDIVGYKAIQSFNFGETKSLGQPGSPTYTADTDNSDLYGEVLTLTGNISITAASDAVIGSGTKFTTELKVGDIIEMIDAGANTIQREIEEIISDTSITLTAVIGSDAVAASIPVRKRSKLQEPQKNISLFKLPYEKIKTLKTTANGGLTDTNFKIRRQFVATLSSGTATITAGTNETFAILSENDYTISVISAGSSSTAVVGNVLSNTGTNHAGGDIFTLGGSPTGKTLELDYGTDYANAQIKIIATVDRSSAGSKTKSTNSNEIQAVSNQVEIENGIINMGKADVKTLNTVFMAPDFSTAATTSHVDITDRFILDNGQRDNYYDIGRLKLKTGALVPTGRLRIDFDYFSHGAGDYFDIDSYTSSGIDYEDVLSYTSDTNGDTYDLRDCLDFRPRVDDASTIDSGSVDRSFDGTGASIVDVVKFNSDVTSDFEYYLPRIDKIFVDKEGAFKVSKGSSALVPQVPMNLAGALHLYTIEIPAYTLSTEDVSVKKIDNRRFTMRDIGKLEDRIQNLEYYTQLSLLETQAQSLQIQDASGFDRFKNGFIVDNFTGHNIGDVGNEGYKCSVDMARGELRPMFTEDIIELQEADDDGSDIVATDRTDGNYAKTGDLISLPFTEVTIVDQPFASKTLNVNPFDIRSFVGTIELNPPTDEWKETERAPELIINNVGGFDTLASNLGNAALGGFEIGTIWNEWQDQWTGNPVDIASRDTSGHRRAGRRLFVNTEITSTQQANQTRTGIRQTIVPQTVRNSIGDRIISVAFVPFIRSRVVSFTATRMKPNTRVYGFFDNVDVASYITPSGGALGGNLTTDANGACTGTFSIPDPKVNANPRWRAGTRVFRLSSSATNRKTDDIQTAAEADYVARGLLETVQNTIISTREPQIVRNAVNEDRSITRTTTRDATRTIGWVDPLAQTFLIDEPGGVQLSSIDVFFSTKDDNIPVTLQIREVINGYPGNKILPFSELSLNPNQVSISEDGATATNFKFPSPVFIQENVEYCMVLLANSQDYNVYASRLGETQLGSNRTISQQPYAGVLFKSQNGSTWTADQQEDLKFKINRAEYSLNPGTVTFVNEDVPTRLLGANSLRTTITSNVIRVFHRNHGMHGLDNNVTISGIPSGTYNGIPHTELNTTFTSISNITLDSYDITVVTNASASGDIGGTEIRATENKILDILNLNVQTMELPGTEIDTTIRTTSGRSVHGAETEFSLTAIGNKQSVVPNDNIYFTTPQMVASPINEANEMTGSKSLFVQFTLQTTNSKLSPVIDLQRCSAIAVQNRINTPTVSNTPDFVAETTSTGASSSAAYITRPITLENASTALDIRLSANVRSSSELEVFYRVISSADTRDIRDLSFVPFNGDGKEDLSVTPAEDDTSFKEYKYSDSSINDFTTFQIKIVMKGSISSYPPKVKDLRGIALAL